MDNMSAIKDVFVVDTRKMCGYFGIETMSELSRETKTAIEELYKCSHSKGGNMAQKYKTYERYVPTLLKLYFANYEMLQKQGKQIERYEKAAAARRYARWTDEEDEALIEMVVQDGIGVHEVSTAFGRSPASIANRLTKLVGIGRVSQEVVGNFVGTINGESVSGQIKGTLRKTGERNK